MSIQHLQGRVRHRPSKILVLGILVTAAATGCRGSAPEGGPLAFGGGVGENCSPAGATNDFTYGFEAVGNPTGHAVKVTGVALVNPERMSLVGSTSYRYDRTC